MKYNELKEETIEKLKIFKDNNFKFEEESHTYTYKKKIYPSVTTFIENNFVRPFNTEFWSMKKAKDRLMDEDIEINEENVKIYQEAIKTEWKTKADNSCVMGSDVHFWIENLFKGNKIDINTYTTDKETIKRLHKIKKLYNEKLYKLIPVAQEVRMFSKKLELAGTFDALFILEGELMILDWKTNSKKFSTDTDKNWNKLLPPFQNEWENLHNKYSIQINIYTMMLKEHGINVKKGGIVHIPSLDEEIKMYKCKDYSQELNMYFGVNI